MVGEILSKAANNSGHILYKSTDQRPGLKIQSELFNKSHLDMQRDASVSIP